MEGFRFSTEVSVRFAETDAQAVAHNSVYLVWLEVARVEYLARFDGGYPALRARGVEALTLETYVRYLAPARFADRVRIYARCGAIRGARFRFEYSLELGGRPIAEAWTAYACVDAQALRPIRMPRSLVEAITEAET